MFVGTAAVVVDVDRGKMSRDRLDGISHISLDSRMSDIQADADVRVFDVLLDELRNRAGTRQIVRDHFDGDPDAERFGHSGERVDAAPRRVAVGSSTDAVGARAPE